MSESRQAAQGHDSGWAWGQCLTDGISADARIDALALLRGTDLDCLDSDGLLIFLWLRALLTSNGSVEQRSASSRGRRYYTHLSLRPIHDTVRSLPHLLENLVALCHASAFNSSRAETSPNAYRLLETLRRHPWASRSQGPPRSLTRFGHLTRKGEIGEALNSGCATTTPLA